jgi:hypothetical protein
MTRHGARSPYLMIEKPDITTDEWTDGLGQLTEIGERQHFLVGRKHRIKYINDLKLLSDKFDPREIFIISTDVNRTIMSAYSEINAWYPMGSVRPLEGDDRLKAIPPYDIVNKFEIISELHEKPTKSEFQPMPIHVSQQIDEMLRAMDPTT